MNPKSSRRILIVEDSPDIQSLLASFLNGDGYLVECASNGHDALKMLHASQTLPDLILLDLMMPEMDGFEFRRASESHPDIALIPIVVMTADGDIQAKATQIKAHGYLKKPFVSLDTILQTIEGVFPK